VTLPQGLTTINRNAFQESGIESITIPGTVTSFQQQVFMGCDKLKTVVFESGVTSANYQIFNRCTALESVTFPSTLTTLGASAFIDVNNADLEVTFEGKTMAQVQAMANYPWALATAGQTIHCTDGDITIS